MKLVMGEEKVRRYLDGLLVELEVSSGDTGIMKKIVDTVNYYKGSYPTLLTEYHEKGSEIINQFR